jgi:Fur family ferric uptake transcriptional regulator
MPRRPSKDATARRTLDDVKRPLRAFLKARNLHESKVRDLVVDTFLSAHEHLGLEQILERARAKNPSVGMATVYRTMKLLEEAGLVHARDFGSGATLYEVSVGKAHHDHLVCDGCAAIVEFVSDDIEALQEKVAEQNGFELRRHRHELFGLCRRCRGRA